MVVQSHNILEEVTSVGDGEIFKVNPKARNVEITVYGTASSFSLTLMGRKSALSDKGAGWVPISLFNLTGIVLTNSAAAFGIYDTAASAGMELYCKVDAISGGTLSVFLEGED